jgi:hypothetical protein
MDIINIKTDEVQLTDLFPQGETRESKEERKNNSVT